VACAHLHRLGVVHGDGKLSNLLAGGRGGQVVELVVAIGGGIERAGGDAPAGQARRHGAEPIDGA
jgi:serine/threonine protein kinase